MESKCLKLAVHPRNDKTFGDLEIVLNSKDHPLLKVGDVVEVFHPDGVGHRVLLQISALRDDFTQKETVSIEQSVVTLFQLQQYKTVQLKPIAAENVTLDLIEVIIKEQYFSRSDFHRFMENMRTKVVYENKKLEFGCMRGQVGEMWRCGQQWSCGYVGQDTRVVFRSATAVVHIFLQMSAEMWEFDFFGDLYFEKAVSGFLTELFSKWNSAAPYTCSHDVTIVLFSRVIYEAREIDALPDNMRKCLNSTIVQDVVNGCFYEDFYQVVIQNERYNEEWTRVLMNLKRCFHDYQHRILNHHRQSCPKRQQVPPARISSAEKGNFLETLNLTLNLYQKYYIDRNFDRTGKICVVVTPGPGVFEVDRELMNVTKQRILDLGVGIDIVCMGEQPLHAVPLFKYVKKTYHSWDIGDDYNIPHWMNHSFYRSQSELQANRMCNFIPRIKLKFQKVKEDESTKRLSSRKKNTRPLEPFTDRAYEEHDKTVFALPRTSDRLTGSSHDHLVPTRGISIPSHRRPRNRHISDNFFGFDRMTSGSSANHNGPGGLDGRSADPRRRLYTSKWETRLSTSDDGDVKETRISFTSMDSAEDEDTASSGGHSLERPVVGSAETTLDHLSCYQPRKALINPFAPNRLNIKTTANRRRWAHVFPTDNHGTVVQPHHKLDGCNMGATVSQKPRSGVNLSLVTCNGSNGTVTQQYDDQNSTGDSSLRMLEPLESSTLIHVDSNISLCSVASESSLIEDHSHFPRSRLSRQTVNMFIQGEQKWHWGPMLDQDTNPVTHTEWNNKDVEDFLHPIGVDWKSLTTPACLPITTDYFPDDREMSQFHQNYHNVLPKEINLEQEHSWQLADERQRVYLRRPLATRDVYREMINHRLGQGFQLIVGGRAGGISGQGGSSTSLTPPITPQSRRLTNQRQLHPHQYHQHQNKHGKCECTEYKLSIGRIFHVVRLRDEDQIEVEILKPRYPYPDVNVQYWYQMQVPDANSFDECETKFCNEKLENFNWSSMDQYTCSRGEGDVYSFITPRQKKSLKFWRSRFFLLPCVNSATNKIIEAIKEGKDIGCDLYEDKTSEELQQLIDGFLRNCEQINKIRRPGQMRKTKFTFEAADLNKLRLDSSGNSNVFTGMGTVAAIATSDMVQSQNQPASVTPVKGNIQSTDEEQLTFKSSYSKVVTAMQDPSDGLSFLTHNGLPAHCFISAEAAYWVRNTLSGIPTMEIAVAYLQNMVDDKIICHASGNIKHKFIFGFYFYCLVPENKKIEIPTCLQSSHSFQFEWAEVAIELPLEPNCDDTRKTSGGAFDCFQLDDEVYEIHSDCGTSTPVEDNFVTSTQAEKWWGERATGAPFALTDSTIHKQAIMDITPGVPGVPSQGSGTPVSSSTNQGTGLDRAEWGSCKYHINYTPLSAFELETQWTVATGGLLGDLIYSWNRKAGICSFHLLPVPCDPFALPLTSGMNSEDLDSCDPLRGPIYIPLNLSAVITDLFSDFHPLTRPVRLDMFRALLLRRFGFVPDAAQPARCLPLRYVHCTGGMCAMIPAAVGEDDAACSHLAQSKGFNQQQIQAHAFAERHTNRAEDRVGIVWAWNHMLTKRWRSNNTGDEHFQDYMLKDFRRMCSDIDGRLKQFIDRNKQNPKNLWSDLSTSDTA